MASFDAYEALLRRWQKSINLIGESTLDDLWRRHFLDSGQILRHLPQSYDALYDIGSGAGFPGLILALLGSPAVNLVESDQRKCTFLREAARLTGATVNIIPCRAEALTPPPAGWPVRRVIVARAVAPLDLFLDFARPLIDSQTLCVMLKGSRAEAELDAARKRWHFRLLTAPSLTDPKGVILILSNLIGVSST